MISIKVRCISLLLLAAILPANSAATYESNANIAVNWLIDQRNVDGSWGAQSTDYFLYTTVAVQALKAAGQRSAAYFEGITWLENHAASNADFSARRAAILAAHGDDVTATIDDMESLQRPAKVGRKGWGLVGAYLESSLDTAIVLGFLANQSSTAELQSSIDYLKTAQLAGPSTGWPVSLETTSDPFSTALVLRTLAALRTLDPTLGTTVVNGLAYLSASVDGASPTYLQALAAQAALEHGDTIAAQVWLNLLVNSQDLNGSWAGQIYDTALAISAFAKADGVSSPAKQSSVLIPDANLRAAINLALGRNAMDDLRSGELLRLTVLNAAGLDISDLTGLESAINLQTVDLRNNAITTTAPIDGLPQLTNLLLEGNPVLPDDLQPIPTLPTSFMVVVMLLTLLIAIKQQHEKDLTSGNLTANPPSEPGKRI